MILSIIECFYAATHDRNDYNADCRYLYDIIYVACILNISVLVFLISMWYSTYIKKDTILLATIVSIISAVITGTAYKNDIKCKEVDINLYYMAKLEFINTLIKISILISISYEKCCLNDIYEEIGP